MIELSASVRYHAIEAIRWYACSLPDSELIHAVFCLCDAEHLPANVLEAIADDFAAKRDAAVNPAEAARHDENHRTFNHLAMNQHALQGGG